MHMINVFTRHWILVIQNICKLILIYAVMNLSLVLQDLVGKLKDASKCLEKTSQFWYGRDFQLDCDRHFFVGPDRIYMQDIYGACCWSSKWACVWRNQQNDLCAEWRLRSVWASTQSDQSKRPCVLRYLISTQRRLWSAWAHVILLVLLCSGSNGWEWYKFQNVCLINTQ